MSLPRALNFANGAQLKSSAVAAVSSSWALNPITGQSWGAGSTISFDVPTGTRSTWLDGSGTYLQFTVAVTPNAAGKVQFSAPDFISKLDLYASAGSFQLESVSDYGTLHWLLRDLCSTRNNHISCDSIPLLTDPERYRCGLTHDLPTGGAAFMFSMPLVSILGTLSAGSQYLPLHALNSPLRLDLNLSSAKNAITCVATTASADYTITACKLVMQTVTISDVAMSQIASMCNNVYAFNSTGFRTHRQVHPALQTTNTLTIPMRADSARSVLTVPRVASSIENFATQSNLERPKAGIGSYQFRVGSSFLNPKPVDCKATALEAYMELCRVFGNVTSESYTPNLCFYDYSQNAAIGKLAAIATNKLDYSAFAIGIELQPFSNIKDSVISGTSTLANPIYLDLTFESAPADAIDFCSFVEMDTVYTIDGNVGTMSVKF